MAIDMEHFAQHLTYTITAPIPQILTDLTTIADFDQIAEAKQKRFNTILVISLIGCFVSLFLLAFGIGIVTLIVCAIAAIFAGMMLNKYRRRNLANYRYEVLRKVLALLTRDIEPNAAVNLTLVLSPPIDANKKTHTGPHPRRSGWKIDYFRDSWLNISGYFLDGTHFSLAATELHITQYGWKRSRSGKSKFKKKSKPKAQELELTMTCPRRKYGAISVLQQDAIHAIQLPDAVRLMRFKSSDRRLSLTAKTPAWVTATPEDDPLYQTITLMFLSLYQILNLARVLSKNSSHSA
ncbi:MAG: hypothetical protein Kow00121_60360 [Elainellaceae cyanobacterium]